MNLRLAFPLLLMFGASIFAGCGGGGGNSGVETAAPSVIVDWPERTRDFGAPSSAESVKVFLHYTSGSQPDVEIEGNRSTTLAAHSETYTYGHQLLLGNYTVTVTFYSQPSLAGVVTATAIASCALFSCGCLENPNDSPLGTVAFATEVKSVSIAPNQVVKVGATAQLNATALDANGNIIALTPGSFQFQIVSGGAEATITPDGILTGLSIGVPTVTSTVDGVTSPATDVTVLAAG